MDVFDNLAQVLRIVVRLVWTWDLTRNPFQRLFQELTCTTGNITCDVTSPYRSIDGTCNNLEHPLWGASNQPYARLLPPVYESVIANVSIPRLGGHGGQYLPSARLVSRTLHGSDAGRPLLEQFTNMHQTWGQFLDHDLSHTPRQANVQSCCVKFDKENTPVPQYDESAEPCFPISIPPNDRYFSKKTCMEFVRSVQTTCFVGVGQQVNRMTAYIDASMIYGHTEDMLKEIRTYVDGKLWDGDSLSRNSSLVPCEAAMVEAHGHSDLACFIADFRATEHPALTALHVIFVRLHNVIAGHLQQVNTRWGDGRLFQESRKIIGAIIQIITYKEFLPVLLGDRVMTQYDLQYNSTYTYDKDVDATILNEFTTAAFRYGHSQVPSKYTIGNESVRLRDMFHKPSPYIRRELAGVTGVLRGLLGDVSVKVDRFFSLGITDHLFENSSDAMSGLDLAAINIQRGRDHGLPPYTAYRARCGLPPLGPPAGGANASYTAHTLLSVYRHVDDVDLYTGSLFETPEPGSMIGPTFRCILARCFRNLKFGDRFWYQNSEGGSAFTQDQRVELQKVTLSMVLCLTSGIENVQISAFKSPSVENPVIPCSKLPTLDFSKWKNL